MNSDSIILRCGECAAKNRVAKSKLNDRPVCGKCRARLPVDRVYDHPVVVTDQSFQAEVVSFPGAVLLDCWAPWCGPCRTIGPMLEQLASEYAGQVKIAKLNVDENQGTAGMFNIMSVPSLLLFKHGQLINTLVGALPRHEIEKHLASII